MKHTEAVKAVVRAFGAHPMEVNVREALKFLNDNAGVVEDLADSYIDYIDQGPLEAWIDASKGIAAFDSGDLDDERLFHNEERAYETAHTLLGIELAWPDGYYDSEPEGEGG